ncbi:MAG: transcriptional regulator [Rickettsiales bacterium]|nr:transcriptional regulator [Rickettsiales bacterium]
MPIYEYQCNSCGERLEALQKMSDPPLVECPSGDGGELRRLMSAHNVGAVAGAPAYGGGCATPDVCGPVSAAQCGAGSCSIN